MFVAKAMLIAKAILMMFLTSALLFVPTLIAQRRKHHSRLAITVLNVIVFVLLNVGGYMAEDNRRMLGELGLVLLPVWLGAIVWACTAVRSAEPARSG